jgi:hypothetical protein
MSAILSSEGLDTTFMGANGEAVTISNDPVSTEVSIEGEQAGVSVADDKQRVMIDFENVRGPRSVGEPTSSIPSKQPDPEHAVYVRPVEEVERRVERLGAWMKPLNMERASVYVHVAA